MTNNIKSTSSPNYSNQSGIVLPIALILLLVTTLLGITSLRSNTVSERMTRNTIQRDLEFNNAESALIEGEELVRDNAALISTAIVNAASSDTCSTAVTIDGTTQSGYCSPANFPQAAGAAASTTERWQIAGIFDEPAAGVTPSYIVTSNGSKVLIEFVGHILNDNNETSCGGGATYETTWPYCTTDAFQFRITALAEGGEGSNAKVMLQSTYVVAP